MRYDFAFSLDEEDNLYASAIYKPLLQKYSSTGELLLESTFEVPFEVPEIKTIRRPEGTFVEAEAVSRAMDIDTKGRIFLLTLTRMKSFEEGKVGLKLHGMRRDGKGGIFTSDSPRRPCRSSPPSLWRARTETHLLTVDPTVSVLV